VYRPSGRISGHETMQTTALMTGGNLLDLLITPKTTYLPLISNVDVLNTRNLSDHDLIVCSLFGSRVKQAAVSYK